MRSLHRDWRTRGSDSGRLPGWAMLGLGWLMCRGFLLFFFVWGEPRRHDERHSLCVSAENHVCLCSETERPSSDRKSSTPQNPPRERRDKGRFPVKGTLSYSRIAGNSVNAPGAQHPPFYFPSFWEGKRRPMCLSELVFVASFHSLVLSFWCLVSVVCTSTYPRQIICGSLFWYVLLLAGIGLSRHCYIFLCVCVLQQPFTTIDCTMKFLDSLSLSPPPHSTTQTRPRHTPGSVSALVQSERRRRGPSKYRSPL